MALKFSDLDESATGAKVGLNPSKSGMPLQDLDADMDAVFKIDDKNRQSLKIVIYNDEQQTVQNVDLSGLTLLDEQPTT